MGLIRTRRRAFRRRRQLEGYLWGRLAAYERTIGHTFHRPEARDTLLFLVAEPMLRRWPCQWVAVALCRWGRRHRSGFAHFARCLGVGIRSCPAVRQWEADHRDAPVQRIGHELLLWALRGLGQWACLRVVVSHPLLFGSAAAAALASASA